MAGLLAELSSEQCGGIYRGVGGPALLFPAFRAVEIRQSGDEG